MTEHNTKDALVQALTVRFSNPLTAALCMNAIDRLFEEISDTVSTFLKDGNVPFEVKGMCVDGAIALLKQAKLDETN